MQRGEAVKPSAPKARLFCDRHFSRLRDCKQRAEDMVPCSAESEFPYLWSTALRSARWMPIDGDPGAHETSSPSCNGEPWEHNWGPLAPRRRHVHPAPDPLPWAAPLTSRPGSPRPRRALPETASLCSLAVRQAGKSGRLGSVGQEFKSRV